MDAEMICEGCEKLIPISLNPGSSYYCPKTSAGYVVRGVRNTHLLLNDAREMKAVDPEAKTTVDPDDDRYSFAKRFPISDALKNWRTPVVETPGNGPDTATSKPSNPKDIIGSGKLPMALAPAVTVAYLALGHAEGMLKYGLVNWREAGVRTSIYLDALDRHIKKFKEGEWADPTTTVPHLANALACISIIIDAHHAGKLIDDRPKSNPGAIAFIEKEGQGIWDRLRKLFGHIQPKHWTIDTSSLVSKVQPSCSVYSCTTAGHAAHCPMFREAPDP